VVSIAICIFIVYYHAEKDAALKSLWVERQREREREIARERAWN